MFSLKNVFKLEERLVFFINFLFVLMVIFSLLYNVSLRYFFYFNLITTFVVSYFFFKRSRKLAKQLIVTNLFIFFYFLYPQVAWFLSEIFSSESYIFIIAYNVVIAYIFLIFSGYKNNLLGNFKKFNFSILGCIILLGLVMGLLFNLVKEPVPNLFLDFANKDLISILIFLVFSSFAVAFSEQMIFSGFLFNTYRKLTSKKDAFYQVSLIFVLFHLLRFEILVKHYFVNFSNWYLVFIASYYLLLFVFMLLCLYFYSFRWKKYEGNFLYPVMFHFMTDLGLFLFYFMGV